MRPDAKELARGKWRGVLIANGIDENALRNVHGPCPACGGKDRFRFDDKEGNGTFYCSNCGAGDGFTLIMNVTGCDFVTAKKRVLEVLPGIAQQTRREVSEEQRTKQRVARIREIWKSSHKTQPGDAVHRYLANRMLDTPSMLRCGKVWYDKDHTFDAMVAPIAIGEEKNIIGLHVTFIKDGRKITLNPAKKTFRSERGLEGGAIRLCDHNGSLGIAEGIETALAAQKIHGVPTWAAMTANGMRAFRIPNDIIELCIFADQDASFTGLQAAYALAFRAKKQGVDVHVYAPEKMDTDWNDVLIEQTKKAQAS